MCSVIHNCRLRAVLVYTFLKIRRMVMRPISCDLVRVQLFLICLQLPVPFLLLLLGSARAATETLNNVRCVVM